jgi:hypothetical protein
MVQVFYVQLCEFMVLNKIIDMDIIHKLRVPGGM